MTANVTAKLQVLVNSYRPRIVGVLWPDTISEGYVGVQIRH